MKKTKVLFVCLGNICRSPTAEAIFKKMIHEQNLSEKFFVDSAGTSGQHAGEPADVRSRKHGAGRGYDLSSISRAVKSPQDFKEFDLILPMDDSNFAHLVRLTPDPSARRKIKLVTDFCVRHNVRGVPDPYYSGPEGFEEVIDILEDACANLLKQIDSIV